MRNMKRLLYCGLCAALALCAADRLEAKTGAAKKLLINLSAEVVYDHGGVPTPATNSLAPASKARNSGPVNTEAVANRACGYEVTGLSAAKAPNTPAVDFSVASASPGGYTYSYQTKTYDHAIAPIVTTDRAKSKPLSAEARIATNSKPGVTDAKISALIEPQARANSGVRVDDTTFSSAATRYSEVPDGVYLVSAVNTGNTCSCYSARMNRVPNNTATAHLFAVDTPLYLPPTGLAISAPGAA